MNYFARIVLVCLFLNLFFVEARRIKGEQLRKMKENKASKQYVANGKSGTGKKSKSGGKSGTSGKSGGQGKSGTGKGKGYDGTAGPVVAPAAAPVLPGPTTSTGDISNDNDLLFGGLRTLRDAKTM